MVLNVYWPSTLRSNGNARLLVGYKSQNGENIVVVSAIEKSWLSILQRQTVISNETFELSIKFPASSSLRLSVVGVLNYESFHLLEFDMLKKDAYPLIHCRSYNLIVFNPPNSKKLEYYATHPAEVDIFWSSYELPLKSQSNQLPEVVQPESEYGRKLAQYSSKSLPKRATSELDLTLRHINLRNYLSAELDSYLKKYLEVSTCNSRKIGSFSLVLYAFSWAAKLMSFIGSYLAILSKFPLKLVNFIIISLINILSYRVGDKSLSTISFSCHQVRNSLANLLLFPAQCQRMRSAMRESEYSIATGSAHLSTEYIKLYNTGWLWVNDILLGVVISRFLTDHADIISSSSKEIISDLLTRRLSYLIRWLMNSPAGFKLNNELAGFLGELTLWVIKIWEDSLIDTLLSPHMVMILVTQIALATQFMGASFFISVWLDLMNILVFHVRCFYFASTRIYHWQLDILRSLFRLFYGKKYNHLRKRIDSNNYELDQLFFGIIIFTILLYLLPTVVVFYLTFVLARLSLFTLTAMCQFLLIGLNYMPLVVFLLRLKRKTGLPGGILFKNLDNSSAESVGVFELKSRSLSLAEIAKSHAKSVLRFNIRNLQMHRSAFPSGEVELEWSTLSPMVLARNVAFGDPIENFSYTTLF
ncbi:unnamed protein product [Kuraishia capsulata CBS 1993]|uniref:Uncharacterized protein n=1 Tax=Kuraishia capsulata CBS 1993 TaxID=1382522 RepID=W6MSZ8_9ASCO|nr:uncharacterized protein KUCA_T00000867001 [Kuraishia capsulata CBS 1993]CDK24900.1 unnamed protein product [Kuraishia capsulata CBS 1993]